MIRTLHGYLSRELLKVAVMALVAFTMVMTVFAIIEPLRKQGLAIDKLFAFILCTLPVMFSLTLPIAALFAATIVYGRFGQDNELMACRASGISTVSLLKPSLVLGATVAIVSLTLSNFVTPSLAAKGEQAIKDNIRGIAFRQLRTRNYVKWGSFFVHASEVDEEHDTLYGVVAADVKDEKNVRISVTPTAFVDFKSYFGETYITVYLVNPVATTSDSPTMFQEASQPLVWGPLPNPAEESPSWYDWGKLIRTLRDPAQNQHIRAGLNQIRRRMGYDMLGGQIARTIQSGRAYDRLCSREERYVVSAADARWNNDNAVLLTSGQDSDGGDRKVQVQVLRDGVVRRVFSAGSGKIQVAWSAMNDNSQITLSLRDNVVVRDMAAAANEPPPSRLRWSVGQLAMPEDITARAARISLEEIYQHGDRYTENPELRSAIEELKTDDISKLTSEIIAEMHTRMAYGVGCFLMVAMGASLGLIFRGGQIISAFSIAVVPAAVVIVMILMGKEMARHPDIATGWGVLTIWGGIAILLAANTYVYVRLLRR